MKITLAPFGTSSDVLPMIALAGTLQSHGHHVTICAAEEFRSRIYKAGYPMFSSGPTYRKYLECEEPLEDGTTELAAKLSSDMATHFVALRDAIRDADVLVGSRLQIAGPSMAEQYRIPYLYAVTTPGVADHDQYPIFGVPQDRAQKRRSRRMKEWDREILAALNRERNYAHLPPVKNLFENVYRSGPVLGAFDPSFAQPKDSTYQIITGSWLLDQDLDLEPEFLEFLNNGPAPVYVAPFRLKEEQSILSLCQSLASNGNRVVLGHGWNDNNAKELPAGCILNSTLSYAQIFPKMAVIVHSGAPDIAAHAIAAHVPQLILPYTVEQMFWARKCSEAGVATSLLTISDLSAVHNSIAQTLQSTTIKDQIGKISLSTNGTSLATEQIEKAVENNLAATTKTQSHKD